MALAASHSAFPPSFLHNPLPVPWGIGNTRAEITVWAPRQVSMTPRKQEAPSVPLGHQPGQFLPFLTFSPTQEAGVTGAC